MAEKDIAAGIYFENPARFADLINAYFFEGEKKDLKGNEFLSGIAKTDRFRPVVTLILCFGKWDGARSLHQLIDMEGIPEKLRERIVDYPLDILEVAEFEHLEYFRTDLKLVFGFIKYAQDKEKLRFFIEQNSAEFKNLAEDAYDLISVMSNTQELKRRKKEDRRIKYV